MKDMYDLIVIGAGSGGLTAAIGGMQIGAKVLLIEKEKELGGDCTHYGCIPCKTLIHESKKAYNIRKYHKTHIQTILKKVQKTVTYIENKSENIEKLKSKGLNIIIGSPTFVDKNTIKIRSKQYSAKKFVIATGSSPRIPTIKGLDEVSYLTNKNIFIPNNFKSLTIIGGGPIGCELGQAFARLGIKVTIIEHNQMLLNREDRDASKLLHEQFKVDDIEIVNGYIIDKVKEENKQIITIVRNVVTNDVKEIKSDKILIAAGRVPNTKGLKLENADIKYDKYGIIINSKTQTSNKKMYAIGDVTKGPYFTHFANHQGKVALTNLIFKLPIKYENNIIPRVTFTTPEIASVGINDDKGLIVLKQDYSDVDRAITDNHQKGFFKILVNKQGYIKGATIVGNNAGEMISEITLAMKNKIKITNIADAIHPYPTYSYGLKDCANQFRAYGYTEKKKRFTQRLFRLNG